MKKPVVLLFDEALTEWQEAVFPSQGLQYIAASLKQSGFKSIILRIPQFIRNPECYCPSKKNKYIFGFYMTSENPRKISTFGGELKSMYKNSMVIVGGPHATFCDRDIIRLPNIDIVVRGEGEKTVVELAKHFTSYKNDPEKIRGITYKTNGSIHVNPDRGVENNIDKFPVPDPGLLDRHSFDIARQPITLLTSRGCPYKCVFCFEGSSNDKVRLRDIKNVLDELEYRLKNSKTRFFNILDDTFTISPERVKKFCRGVKKLSRRYGKLQWFCQGRINVLSKNPELLGTLVDAGVLKMQCGIESGNPGILKKYGKSITLEQTEFVIKKAFDAGLRAIYGGFIIGGIYETEKTAWDTINFMKKLIRLSPGVFHCGASLLSPLPGTPVRISPDKYDIKILDKDFVTGWTTSDIFVETKHLSSKRILELYDLFNYEMNKTMQEVIPRIDYETLETIMTPRNDIPFLSNWSNFFKNDGLIKDFFKLKNERGYRRLCEVAEKEIFSWYPIRFSRYFTHRKNCIKLITAHRIIPLNTFSSRLFIFSAGKLRLSEILEYPEIQRLAKRELKKSNKKNIKEVLLDTFQTLEKHYAILWKKF